VRRTPQRPEFRGAPPLEPTQGNPWAALAWKTRCWRDNSGFRAGYPPTFRGFTWND